MMYDGFRVHFGSGGESSWVGGVDFCCAVIEPMSRRCYGDRVNGARRAPVDGLRRQAVPAEKMLEKLHGVLYDEVGPVAKACFMLEKKWSESEMTRRIVGYLYKSACNPELVKMDWKDCCTAFVNGAMNAYAASCHARNWFYKIQLAPVFGRAAVEILTASVAANLPSWEDVNERAIEGYNCYLDECCTQKGIWTSVTKFFPFCPGDKLASRISSVLQKTHKQACDHVLEDSRLEDDVDRVEAFVKKWMEDSLPRIWMVLGSDARRRSLTPAVAEKLFHQLIAPFGLSHDFSCLPIVLWEAIGRPGSDWKFVAETARNIFWRWEQEAARPRKKRRKTGGGESVEEVSGGVSERAAVPVGPGEPDMEELLDEDEADAQDEEFCDGEDDEVRRRHPDCRSEEDCQGLPTAGLVRHILVDGTLGDIYCKTCWDDFCRQNSSLRGEPLAR